MEDYYTILEVSPYADATTIRESYRKLALRFHPDKNKDESATSDFQRLVKAWEILQDEGRREVYDRESGRGLRRETGPDYDDSLRTRKSREERDRSSNDWANSMGHDLDNERYVRRERSHTLKENARLDYLVRLKLWNDVRKQYVPLALERQRSIRLQEGKLALFANMSECDAIFEFQKAIEVSQSAGKTIDDPPKILSQLCSARKIFLVKISEDLSNSIIRYHQILSRLEENQRQFELAEIDAQQLRIQEALEILGPRSLFSPLLIDVDRRLRAINRWESLSKVGSAQSFSPPSLDLLEGPWHSDSREWDRLTGEHQCSRCERMDFHVIPECRPASCPACGIVVCNDCYRDLSLLRNYSEWVMSSVAGSETSMFSLEV